MPGPGLYKHCLLLAFLGVDRGALCLSGMWVPQPPLLNLEALCDGEAERAMVSAQPLASSWLPSRDLLVQAEGSLTWKEVAVGKGPLLGRSGESGGLRV